MSRDIYEHTHLRLPILKFDEDHIQEIYLESHMNNIFWKPKL